MGRIVATGILVAALASGLSGPVGVVPTAAEAPVRLADAGTASGVAPRTARAKEALHARAAKPRSSRLTLAHRGDRFVGKIRPRACAAGRAVVVKQVGAGRIGKTRTNRKGKFVVAAGPAQGTFKVTAKPARGCRKATARLVVAAPPGPDPSVPVTPVGPVDPGDPVGVAVVAVRGGGVVLPAVGHARQLGVDAYDAAGKPVAVDPAAVTWEVRDPGVVTVSDSGLAEGVALGSTTVTATIDGVRSAESLALVIAPPAGAVLVSDDQVAGLPEFLAEPGEEPDFDTPVAVELTGLPAGPPAVGGLVLSTESVPVAGRVTSVEDLGEGRFRVVLTQVSMREALGEDFDIDGDLDLSGTEYDVDEALEEFYDITRDGDTLTFDPKPDTGNGVVAGRAGASARARGPRQTLSAGPCGRKGGDPTGPLECSFLGDKLSCEISGTGITNTPFRLTAPPAFKVELSPSLDTTEQGDETFRWVLSAHPKVTITQSLKLEAAVEFKAECKMELAKPKIPAPGLAGVFLAGIFPLGVGFEFNPKLSIANLEFGVKASIGGQASLGLTCHDVLTDSGFEEDCDVLTQLSADDPVFEPVWHAPSLGDARLNVAFQAFAFADIKIGPPTVEKAQLEIGGFKLGPKAEADLATRTSQINDADYASSVKATLPLDLTIGAKLGRVARLLGMSEVKAFDQPLVEADLDITPTGDLTAETVENNPDLDDGDPDTMDTGDRVRFTGTLRNPDGFNPKFPDPTTFLGLSALGIDEVLLVDKFGEIIATQPGVAGKTDYVFDLDVVSADNTTNGPGQIKFGRFTDTYLFIKTDVPIDLLGLEIAHATVAEPEPVIEVLAAGDAATCSVRPLGTVACWGQAFKLGVNGTGRPESSPIPGLIGVTDLALRTRHACAIQSAGTVICWGDNEQGQLGGTPEAGVAEVAGIDDAIDVAVGQVHSCAVLAGGGVRCWGYGGNGQLGDSGPICQEGTCHSSPVPVPVVGIDDAIAIAAGTDHTCALRATGAVACWGRGGNGQLGDGVSSQPECVGHETATRTCQGVSVPVAVADINDAIALAAGSHGTCVVHDAGAVSCWGITVDRFHLTVHSKTPVTVTGIGDAVDISAAGQVVCALRDGGLVSCWGDGELGQLGDGTSGDERATATPVAVAGIEDAVEIAVGGIHACALLADTTIRCWGDGGIGKLGDGRVGNHQATTPTKVLGIPAAVSISGRVGHDENASGTVDESEPGIFGVTIEVRSQDGELITTALSGPDGSYFVESLDPLQAGEHYKVTYDPASFGLAGFEAAGPDTAQAADLTEDGDEAIGVDFAFRAADPGP